MLLSAQCAERIQTLDAAQLLIECRKGIQLRFLASLQWC